MSSQQHKTVQELIQQIEKKDRRFRIAQFIFNSLLVLMIVGIGYFIYISYQEEQITRDKSSKEIIQSIENKVEELQDQITCTGIFFEQRETENQSLETSSECTDRVDGEQSLIINFAPGPQQSNGNNNTKTTSRLILNTKNNVAQDKFLVV